MRSFVPLANGGLYEVLGACAELGAGGLEWEREKELLPDPFSCAVPNIRLSLSRAVLRVVIVWSLTLACKAPCLCEGR